MGPYGPFVEDVIVVGGAVFSEADLPPSAVDAYRRLAASSSTPVLGVAFAGDGTGAVAGITPLPDLRAGGDAAIDAVAEALAGGPARDDPGLRHPDRATDRQGAPRARAARCARRSCSTSANSSRAVSPGPSPSRRVGGWLGVDGHAYDLESFTGVYARLMDDRLLPELDGEPDESPRRRRCRQLHDQLVAWMDVAPARVVNRFRTMGSNGSKPYQAQLIRRHGFRVPETLVTNDAALVRQFCTRHGRAVYKSISGIRSIVAEVTAAELDRLDAVQACPVQFQAFVPGFDVRVHTVGDEVFATRIDSPGTDYRYAAHDGDGTRLEPYDIPEDLARRCCQLAAAARAAVHRDRPAHHPRWRRVLLRGQPEPGLQLLRGAHRPTDRQRGRPLPHGCVAANSKFSPSDLFHFCNTLLGKLLWVVVGVGKLVGIADVDLDDRLREIVALRTIGRTPNDQTVRRLKDPAP